MLQVNLDKKMAETITTIPAGVDAFYNRIMLKAAIPLLVYLKFAQVKDLPAHNGMNIRFRRYGVLAANTTALSEGVTPQGTALSYTAINATVSQYGGFITITDVLSFSTTDPILTEMSDKLGQQAANSLDQIVRDVLVAGASEQYASSATSTATVTASMTLTRDEIREAVRTLQGNDAKKITRMVNPSTGFNTSPLNASYIGIIDHMTLYDLKNEVGWVPVNEYPSQSDTIEGEVGSLDDVRFIMTTNGYSVASTLTTVHKTLILAQDFYGISRISGEALRNIVKPLGSGGTADPLDQRSTSGWKATFVAMVLNSNFGVVIEHGCTA